MDIRKCPNVATSQHGNVATLIQKYYFFTEQSKITTIHRNNYFPYQGSIFHYCEHYIFEVLVNLDTLIKNLNY